MRNRFFCKKKPVVKSSYNLFEETLTNTVILNNLNSFLDYFDRVNLRSTQKLTLNQINKVSQTTHQLLDKKIKLLEKVLKKNAGNIRYYFPQRIPDNDLKSLNSHVHKEIRKIGDGIGLCVLIGCFIGGGLVLESIILQITEQHLCCLVTLGCSLTGHCMCDFTQPYKLDQASAYINHSIATEEQINELKKQINSCKIKSPTMTRE